MEGFWIITIDQDLSIYSYISVISQPRMFHASSRTDLKDTIYTGMRYLDNAWLGKAVWTERAREKQR